MRLNNKRKIAIVAPIYSPFNSSAAVQLQDLAESFTKLGCDVTVFTPSQFIKAPIEFTHERGVDVWRVKTPKFRDIGFMLRGAVEFFVPYLMIIRIRKHHVDVGGFDGLIWYSPSIFFTPLVKWILKHSACPNYLIVRDIFPQWTVDLGLLKSKTIYFFLRLFELRQYKLADYIGVQSYGNLSYISKEKNYFCKVEVLNNWIHAPKNNKGSISLIGLRKAGRRIFVYAGNFGVAQNLYIFSEVARQLEENSNVWFIFVGRGEDFEGFKSLLEGSKNCTFFDEIPSEHIHDLLVQCDYGIVCLHEKHKSHNIPGKFIAYMASGVPVLALVNSNNDLISLIKNNGLGEVTSEYMVSSLVSIVREMAKVEPSINLRKNCRDFYRRHYNPLNIAKHLIGKIDIKNK